MLNLFPELKTPYYIWGPPWDDNSSGVRALHLLCHALNEMGERAYLVPVNTWYRTNPALNTPVLSEEHLAYYEYHNKAPIVVYPDIIEGNPFQAKHVVRWLLAPAGAYGGSATFPETDKIYGYTKDLADKVLCLPTFDERIFNQIGVGERSGECYYAHKYDKIHSEKLLPLTNNMTRCQGTPEEVAQILKTHKVCYVYERSEILVNAMLCGCKIFPVLTGYWDGKLPKEFFDEHKQLRPQSLLRALFKQQLLKFIEETKQW